jgi:hypothetical protein
MQNDLLNEVLKDINAVLMILGIIVLIPSIRLSSTFLRRRKDFLSSNLFNGTAL